jgi:hypothetical protein
MVGLAAKDMLSSSPEMHGRTPGVGYSHWVETVLAGFKPIAFFKMLWSFYFSSCGAYINVGQSYVLQFDLGQCGERRSTR